MKNMKLVLATAAIAASVTVFAANGEAEPGTEGQGVGAIGWTPVQIGLFAPVSIPWGFDWDVKAPSSAFRTFLRALYAAFPDVY